MSGKKSVDVGNVWWFWFTTSAFDTDKRLRRLFRMLPRDPRCKFCHAPFQGVGGVFSGLAYFGAVGTAEGLTDISAIGDGDAPQQGVKVRRAREGREGTVERKARRLRAALGRVTQKAQVTDYSAGVSAGSVA